MWSRKFLWQGLTTGVLAAALALGAIWLPNFFLVSDPSLTIGSIHKLRILPSLTLYPICWYALVYRHRNYSVGRTTTLVSMTYLAVWALVAIFTALRGPGELTKMLMPLLGGPFIYTMMVIIGAGLLFLPFVVVAAPIAFLHRWLLLLIAPNSAPTTSSAEPSTARTE